MGQIYLNGEPVDKLPEYALKIMSERLSRVVSQYFSEHPDEYVRYLEGRKKRMEAKLEAERNEENGKTTPVGRNGEKRRRKSKSVAVCEDGD